jgi:hypothetical protein
LNNGSGKTNYPGTIDRGFTVCDEISRIMQGTKDYTSVKSEGKKVHLQKLLILCNLQEADLSFKEQGPEKFKVLKVF